MGTEIEHFTPDDDVPSKRDGYAKFCESKTAEFLFKKVENCRKNMEENVGKPVHAKLVIEHEVAKLQLDNAILEEKFKALEVYAHEVNKQLQETRERLEHALGYVEAIPQRLLILENSYAHLMMQVQGNKYVDQIVQAYKMGQHSDKS